MTLPPPDWPPPPPQPYDRTITTPGWWDLVRQIIMFLLAVFMVLFSMFTSGYDIPFLVTALILFGLIPAENIISRKTPKPEPKPTPEAE